MTDTKSDRVIESTTFQDFEPRTVVFATNLQSQYVISYLAQQKYLAGVIVPDPSELGEQAIEASHLVTQLQQAGIPFQCCCKEKLSIIHQQLTSWQVNLGVIVGFPHILPKELLHFFTNNIFNFHAAKLPEYPGPRPLYWQIRNKEKETALVLHRVEQQVDSGNIVAQRLVPINELDTLASLTNRVAQETPSLLAELIDALVMTSKPPNDDEQNRVNDIAQEHKGLPKQRVGVDYARRPTSQDYIIDMNSMTAPEISAMSRAGNGLPPSALIYIKNMPVNVMQASPVNYPTYGTKPGTIVYIGEPEGLIVCVKDGAIRLDILANAEGIYSGLVFAEYFHLDAGEALSSVSSSLLK